MFPPDGHLVEPPSFLFCLERKTVNKLGCGKQGSLEWKSTSSSYMNKKKGC
ncbi:hypothetical protein SD78_0893 [Bacillus badius]|nr:hypothetical protein SD78_0893 [Bacillus badius]